MKYTKALIENETFLYLKSELPSGIQEVIAAIILRFNEAKELSNRL